MSHHDGDGASILMGFISTLISGVLGWITIASMSQAFFLGATGALGGWVVKRLMDYIIRGIKNQSTKPKKKR